MNLINLSNIQTNNIDVNSCYDWCSVQKFNHANSGITLIVLVLFSYFLELIINYCFKFGYIDIKYKYIFNNHIFRYSRFIFIILFLVYRILLFKI